MPSFSHKDSLNFWYHYKDPTIYRVITFMESMESWTIDNNPTLETALNKLGKAMDNLGNIDLQKEDDFIKVAAYLKASRTLYLLQCMDKAHPGAASKLLSHAEKVSHSTESVPGLFLRRNVIFERLRLLSRIFSQERLALMQNALEDEEVE